MALLREKGPSGADALLVFPPNGWALSQDSDLKIKKMREIWAHGSCLRRPSKPSYREELASKGPHDMPEQKQMVFRPNADFSDRGNWISLGNDRYGALRIRLVLIPSKVADSRSGPMLEEAYNIDGAHEQEIKTKRGRVIINQTTMSGAIEQATTARLFDRVSAKVGAEASAGVPLNSIKFASELNAEFASEVTNSLKRILSEESSYTIQETEEKEYTLKLKPGNGLKTAYLRDGIGRGGGTSTYIPPSISNFLSRPDGFGRP
jgi:hypothetical protein